MEKDEESPTAAGCLAVLVVAVVLGLLWRQVRDLFTWWWDLSTGITAGLAIGELALFGAGLFAALLALLAVLTFIGKALGFAGDLGASFKDGWRKGGEQQD